jgi:hypothetical protein
METELLRRLRHPTIRPITLCCAKYNFSLASDVHLADSYCNYFLSNRKKLKSKINYWCKKSNWGVLQSENEWSWQNCPILAWISFYSEMSSSQIAGSWVLWIRQEDYANFVSSRIITELAPSRLEATVERRKRRDSQGSRSIFLCVSESSKMKLRREPLHSPLNCKFKEGGGADFMREDNGRLICNLMWWIC